MREKPAPKTDKLIGQELKPEPIPEVLDSQKKLEEKDSINLEEQHKGIDFDVQDEVIVKPELKQWFSKKEAREECRKRGFFVTDNVFFPLLESFKDSHPDWFKTEKLFHSRHISQLYGPDLINEICKLLIPKDWFPIGSLPIRSEITHNFIKKKADFYIKEYPQWIKKSAQKITYISPELLEVIKKDFAEQKQKLELLPKEVKFRALAKRLNLGGDRGDNRKQIISLFEKYKKNHPEYIYKYITEDLANLFIQEIKSRKSAPLNWKTRHEVAVEFGQTDYIIQKITDELETEHPDWLERYYDKKNKFVAHYSPEFIEIIKNKINTNQPSKDWRKIWEIAGEDKYLYYRIKRIINSYRETNPDWLKKDKNIEYCSPELIDIIRAKLIETASIEIGTLPEEGWEKESRLAKDFGVSSRWVKKIIEPIREEHPEWFRMRKITGLKDYEYYHPEVKKIVKKEVERFQKWKSPRAVLKELKEKGVAVTDVTIRKFANNYKQEHPDWFLNRSSKNIGSRKELYSYQLVEIIKENFKQYPSPLENWKTIPNLMGELDVSHKTIIRIGQKFLNKHLDWSKKHKDSHGISIYYSPELVEKIKAEILEIKSTLENSITSNELAIELQVSPKIINRIANKYKVEHPEWFKLRYNKSGASSFYYPKELADIIRSAVALKKETDNLKKEEGSEDEALEKWKEKWFKTKIETDKLELIGFVQEVKKGEKIEAQQFRKLVGLFGSSRAMDVLYKFRPEFKGLPVQWVKSVIADYIGDFLVIRHGFRGEDVPDAIEYLHEASLREGLLEVMKESCLDFYHLHKKSNSKQDDREIIVEYIIKIKQDMAGIDDENLLSVINDLESYYMSLLEINKPSGIINEVKEGREFPDLNQRINIKEIGDKRKLLIADEMGLGKSASAILAKESLGVRQALVIVPSNVVDTWRRYLIDYFKPGEQPSVLIIEDIEQLRQDLSGYEYILISHERINDEYTKELLNINPGMLIVDEIHKFKNIREGVRSQNLTILAQKIQGEDKYMAVLSGTPVPNKIVDVALILKLLYPEKFGDIDSREMAESIIHGDLINLRSLLIPRMQMKSLRESVEMPQYIENPPIEVELSDLEKDIYGVLLEEDELTATQKIQLLRQFLLNPEIIDATPGIHSSKSAELERSLNRDFQKVDKIVMFVNGYVEGVIRGPKSIIPKLNIPDDVEVRIIEGEVSKKDREAIESELNTSSKKILLVVSGQTADVGVDFSGGEMVYFYNDPWTEYDKAQQLARVYRPGLKHDLESKTFIAKHTIEEGIHKFIAIKRRSVEKLLKGVPLTELDKEILKKTEKQDEDKEVNPELARYYFNSWDRLMRIFGEVREIGEKGFRNYLDEHGKELTHGEEYAKAYFDLGNRSYQSNANRIAGTLLENFMKEAGQVPNNIQILDLASGPEMLKRHSADQLADRIVSVDINPAHFSKTKGNSRVIGQLTSLPFATGSFDYVNLTFALHYTPDLIPRRGQIERLGVLKEMSRVLRLNGRVIIDLIHSVDIKDSESFKENVKLLGLHVVEAYTGSIENGDNYKSKIITLEKINDLAEDFSVEELVQNMDKEQLNGFRFRDTKGKLKDSRRIITKFNLGDREFNIKFNNSDQKTYQEEQSIIEKGEGLKAEYGGIAQIPVNKIVDNLFVRYRPRDTYRLFKRLQVSEGGVIIK